MIGEQLETKTPAKTIAQWIFFYIFSYTQHSNLIKKVKYHFCPNFSWIWQWKYCLVLVFGECQWCCFVNQQSPSLARFSNNIPLNTIGPHMQFICPFRSVKKSTNQRKVFLRSNIRIARVVCWCLCQCGQLSRAREV